MDTSRLGLTGGCAVFQECQAGLRCQGELTGLRLSVIAGCRRIAMLVRNTWPTGCATNNVYLKFQNCSTRCWPFLTATWRSNMRAKKRGEPACRAGTIGLTSRRRSGGHGAPRRGRRVSRTDAVVLTRLHDPRNVAGVRAWFWVRGWRPGPGAAGQRG